jgi:hypothetical protein
MRYLVGFVFVLALVASPLGVSAQTAGEVSASEPVSEEPALQLKLDAAGVEVAPSPLRTADGYTLEEMDVRVQRAAIGIVGSAVAFIVGGTLVATGVGGDCGWGGSAQREKCDRRAYAGTALAAGGAIGMIATGILLGVRKRKLRRLQQAHYGRPHRVQWDLARSRLVL